MPCVCGGPRRETQQFCFHCWVKLPAKMQYDLCDGDSAKRAFAHADAQHFLEHMHLRSDEPDRPDVDRKTASTGER